MCPQWRFVTLSSTTSILNYLSKDCPDCKVHEDTYHAIFFVIIKWTYVTPAIKEIWKIHTKGIFEEFRDNDIIVFGCYKCFKVFNCLVEFAWTVQITLNNTARTPLWKWYIYLQMLCLVKMNKNTRESATLEKTSMFSKRSEVSFFKKKYMQWKCFWDFIFKAY